jgi:hypothetical protein
MIMQKLAEESVRVRDDKGHEGFAAAWYLEKVQTATLS